MVRRFPSDFYCNPDPSNSNSDSEEENVAPISTIANGRRVSMTITRGTTKQSLLQRKQSVMLIRVRNIVKFKD